MNFADLAGPNELHGPCTSCDQPAYRVRVDGPISHSDTGDLECDPATPMCVVTINVAIPYAALDREYDGTPSEFADAICGRLNEVDTNTGGVVVPGLLVLS